MLPRLFPHVFPLTGLLHLGFPLIIVSVSCDFTSHVVLCTFIKSIKFVELQESTFTVLLESFTHAKKDFMFI